MRFGSFFVALALAGPSSAIGRREDANQSAPSTTAVLASPKRYIVEFAEGTDHAEAVNELNSRPGLKVVKVFNNTDIFAGVAVEASGDSTDSLQAVRAVSRVWPSKKMKLEPVLDAVNFTGGGVTDGLSSPNYTIGGGFGPGYKVAGGYDYVGDGDWPIGDKQPDNDPIDHLGHGTHTAGILAANGPWFVGVAPEATLLAYKVVTEEGFADEDTLIQAFTDAYAAGADIITASVGAPSGWQDNAWAVVADRLVEAGVVVTIATGNDGNLGPFYASDGSSGKNVLAVASVEPSVLSAPVFDLRFTDTNETTPVAYQPQYGNFPYIQDEPLIFLEDPCSALPADTPNLANLLPLLPRGRCRPAVMEQNLAPFNATRVLVYTPSGVDDSQFPDNWTLGRGILQTGPAELLVAALQAGRSATGTFPQSARFASVPNKIAGTPSYFTGWGGTYDLALKPDIAAPGSNILSLFLDNGYTVMSGASMAAPYVAGVAALYVGKYGGRSTHGAGFAKKLAARILSSGQAVPWGSGSSYNETLASAAQVGNGLINATKVLSYDSELSFAKFNLNDTAHYERNQSVNITNNGAVAVEYTFEVQPAGGFEAYWPNGARGNPAPRMKTYDDVEWSPISIAPKVKLSCSKLVVNPGETKTAKFVFDIPDGLNAKSLPVFSGQVLVKGNNGEQLAVPYFGVGSDLRHDLTKIWDEGDGYPKSYSTNNRTSLATKSSFTFNLSLAEQDFPKLFVEQTYGTKELRWDIFDESWSEQNWTYPLVAGQNGFLGVATSWSQAATADVFDPSKDDENDLSAFPVEFLVRDYTYEFWWFGKFANGSNIAPGKYKMRIATLLPFGDRAISDDWQVWETPTIEVVA